MGCVQVQHRDEEPSEGGQTDGVVLKLDSVIILGNN